MDSIFQCEVCLDCLCKLSIDEDGTMFCPNCVDEDENEEDLFPLQRSPKPAVVAVVEKTDKGKGPERKEDSNVKYFNEVLYKSKSVLSEIEGDIDDVKEAISKFEYEKSIAQKKLTDQMKKLRHLLQQKEEELLDELSSQTVEISSVLEDKRQHLLDLFDTTKETIQKCEKGVDTNVEKLNQILNMKWDYYKIDLNELENETGDTPSFIEFQENNNTDYLFENLGFITNKQNKGNKKSAHVPASRHKNPTLFAYQAKLAQRLAEEDDLDSQISEQKIPLKIYGPAFSGSHSTSLSYPWYLTVIPRDWIAELGKDSPLSKINDDILVVSNTGCHEVLLIEKSTGNLCGVFGSQGSELGQLSYPRGVAVEKCDEKPFLRLFVVDRGNNRIQVYDVETGQYLTHLSQMKAWGITVIPKTNQLIVTNMNLNTITIHQGHSSSQSSKGRVFGEVIHTITSSAQLNFSSPCGVAINSKNHIIISSHRHRIDIFDSVENGCKFLYSFGSHGKKNGQFDLPLGLAVDAKDNIFVSDSYNNRVQMLNEKGEWIKTFGEKGSEEGTFYYPSGIALIDSDKHILVIDRNNHRIQLFEV